jgi:hypothetical protein
MKNFRRGQHSAARVGAKNGFSCQCFAESQDQHGLNLGPVAKSYEALY